MQNSISQKVCSVTLCVAAKCQAGSDDKLRMIVEAVSISDSHFGVRTKPLGVYYVEVDEALLLPAKKTTLIVTSTDIGE